MPWASASHGATPVARNASTVAAVSAAYSRQATTAVARAPRPGSSSLRASAPKRSPRSSACSGKSRTAVTSPAAPTHSSSARHHCRLRGSAPSSCTTVCPVAVTPGHRLEDRVPDVAEDDGRSGPVPGRHRDRPEGAPRPGAPRRPRRAGTTTSGGHARRVLPGPPRCRRPCPCEQAHRRQTHEGTDGVPLLPGGGDQRGAGRHRRRDVEQRAQVVRAGAHDLREPGHQQDAAGCSRRVRPGAPPWPPAGSGPARTPAGSTASAPGTSAARRRRPWRRRRRS